MAKTISDYRKAIGLLGELNYKYERVAGLDKKMDWVMGVIEALDQNIDSKFKKSSKREDMQFSGLVASLSGKIFDFANMIKDRIQSGEMSGVSAAEKESHMQVVDMMINKSGYYDACCSELLDFFKTKDYGSLISASEYRGAADHIGNLNNSFHSRVGDGEKIDWLVSAKIIMDTYCDYNCSRASQADKKYFYDSQKRILDRMSIVHEKYKDYPSNDFCDLKGIGESIKIYKNKMKNGISRDLGGSSLDM